MKTKLAIVSGMLNLVLLFALLKAHLVADNSAKTNFSKPPSVKEVQESRLTHSEELQIGIANWNQLASADFSQYARNLRGLKCPEKVVELIIMAEIDSGYRAHASNLMTRANIPAKLQYWRNAALEREFAAAVARYRSLLGPLAAERADSLRSAIGANAAANDLSWAPMPESPAEMRSNFSYLSDDKRDQVRAVAEATNAKIKDLMKNGYSPDTSGKIRTLREELGNQLAGILPPEQKELFDLYTSPIAFAMNDEFKGIDLNEGEFKAIFQLRKQLDDRLNLNSEAPPGQEENRRQSLLDLANATKQTIGNDRFDEYLRLRDSAYRDVLSFSEKASLPQGTAVGLYNVQKAAQASAELVRYEQTDTQTRQDKLNRIKAETEAEVQRLLGNASDGYRTDYRGFWLRDLGSVSPPEKRIKGVTSIITIQP